MHDSYIKKRTLGWDGGGGIQVDESFTVVELSFVTLNCSGSACWTEAPAAFFDSDEVDRTEDFDDDVGVALGLLFPSTVALEVEVLPPCNGLDTAFLPNQTFFRQRFQILYTTCSDAHRDSGVVG